MVKKSLRFLVLISSVFIISCQTGPCKRTSENPDLNVENHQPGSLQIPMDEKIKVFKADGTKQCGQGQRVSLLEMEKELKGIKIYQSYNKNDGQMRVQMCGAPTGNCNVYEIDSKNLEQAKKQGFKEWIFD